MYDVGVVRKNAGDEDRVASSCAGVDVGLFLKSVGVGCTLGAEAPKEVLGACQRSASLFWEMPSVGDVGIKV